MERGKRLLAEFVGAFALVFVGVGATISSQVGGGPVAVALAHGLTIAVMVSAVGHISGGHFNPAITIGAWVTQRIGAVDAVLYLVIQALGGVAGAFLVRLSMPERIWESVNLGVPAIFRGGEGIALSTGQAVLIEAVLTFFLVWVVFGTAMDPDGAFGKIAGLAIGFTIAVGVFMGGPLTGGTMNPVRALGPMLAAGSWGDWWVYWVGPIAGGVIAALLYDSVMLRRRPTAVDEALGEVVEQPAIPHEHEGDLPEERGMLVGPEEEEPPA